MVRRKKVFLSFLVLALLSVSAISFGRVRAENTDQVTATVTARNISVSVDNETIAFGTIGVGSSADTTAGGVNDSTTATNNGNVTEDINITATDTADWTLEAVAGGDQYTMKYCISDCDATPSWISMSTDYVSLKDDLAQSGTQEFDLQVGTPASTADFTQQSISITVQATLPD